MSAVKEEAQAETGVRPKTDRGQCQKNRERPMPDIEADAKDRQMPLKNYRPMPERQ